MSVNKGSTKTKIGTAVYSVTHKPFCPHKSPAAILKDVLCYTESIQCTVPLPSKNQIF